MGYCNKEINEFIGFIETHSPYEEVKETIKKPYHAI